MASDTSLVFNVLAVDRATAIFRKIARSADSTGKTLRNALGPALGPVLATSTAGVVGLGAALAGVGASAGVFAAVFKTSFTEVQDASSKTDDLREKISLLGEQIKVANETGLGDASKLLKAQQKAQNELIARYRMMPPALRQVTMSYDNMKASWQGFVDANKPTTYAVMTRGFTFLTSVIPKLQPLFNVAGNAATKLLKSLNAWSAAGGVDRMVAFLTANAVPAFDNLLRIGRNVAKVIGAFFTSFDEKGQGVLQWLADASDKWAAWATQKDGGGLQKFVDYVDEHGPAVISTLSSLAESAKKIADAVAPLAPVSLAVAGGLAAIINAVPEGVITGLVAGWIAFNIAMKAYALYTGIATAAQWLMNTALLASPITWIVLAVIALIAVIVLIATKTTWFQTIWKAAWGWIKTAAGAAWGWIKEKALAFWNWIKAVPGWIRDKFRDGWNNIKTAAATMWSRVKTAASDAWNKIKTGVSDNIKKVTKTIKDLPGKIKSALGDLGKLLLDSGKKLISGLIDGITGKVAALRDKLGWVTSMLPDWKGPMTLDLRILEPSGKAVMQGFMTGIDAQMPALRNKLGGVASTAEKLLAHIRKGGMFFEDMSWVGMSGADAKNVSKLADRVWSLLPKGFDFGPAGTREAVMGALKKVIGAPATTSTGTRSAGSPMTSATPVATVRVVVDVQGGDSELKRMIRKMIRVEGL